MSVLTPDLLHSLAYTNTVNNPVSRKIHQTQFPETPFCLTISVTKFGVSVENVVATIDIPSIHHGMFLPDKKNSLEFFPDFFDDFLYTFNYEVRESFFNNVKIRIKFLKNGKIYSCESKVINIIEDKNLLILEGNNTIFFQDVIEIQS